MIYVDNKTSKTKQTLCFITDQFITGGVEKVLFEAVRCLSKDYSITIEVMCGYATTEICDSFKDYGEIRIHHCNNKHLIAFGLPFVGGYYLRHVLGCKYDYVIPVKGHFIMAAYGSRESKTIFWNHGDKDTMYDSPNLSLLRKLNKIRLRMGYKKMDAVWVLTDSIKTRLESAFSLKNISVLNNPVDTHDIITKGNSYVPDFQRKPDALNIVSVSRLSEEKGQLRLLKAIHALSCEIPCFVTLVGDGPCRADLEAFVSAHAMQDMVYFAGTKSNPYPYMKQADLFVLPSYMEPFGLVIVEAMLLETGIVVTETTGASSITCNGRYGILVDNSIEGICRGIRQYNAAGEGNHELIQQAKTRAMEFDKSYFYKELQCLLSNVNAL